ncbi:MAG: hypothetical protein [Virus sp.]|nr:MAG: hypothetical protein [Virus sp.]
MGELKTIISANIPVSLAGRLKNKTKGTRSRVITRALTAYLDEKEAFNITEVPSRQLLAVLSQREDIPEHLKVLCMQELTQ